ncbi:hypothetical protein BEL04_14205 [Mucilaginibacter sp. PPCGB 2223]|uniref:hypothetical protein n=1 Tax=Mucilaginibacter sp. PPCGB 2223 TaxID=1886027 RepID=UPI00082537B4|nr:hypothetical protein [Mucilaginibacter sp. PPCGB 2223]OCX52597.1 hypothetical protein BEL04_14205 [Mucilaginibacter sp. PPCGB 2223]
MQSTIITPDKAAIELPIPENYIGKKIVVTYTIEEVNVPTPNTAEKVNASAVNVVEPAIPGKPPRTLHGSKTSTNGGSGTMHEHG